MPLAVAQRLARDPDVAYVEQDVVARAVETLPSGVSRIEAHLNTMPGSVNVKVAVVDTGVDLDHQDLNVVQGVDCTGGSGCSSSATAGDDGNGHGTHVAGTIGAIDNDIDVVGVAPGTPIVAVKVLGDDGSGSFDDVIAGINWVTAQGDIPVINMSLSGIGFMQSLRDAIINSVAAGVVHVCAAGNDDRDIYGTNGVVDTSPVSESFVCLLFGRNCNGDNIPAAYPEVLTVSASDPSNDDFASFSNYSADVDPANPVISMGAAIDLNAPGVNIVSLAAGGGTTTKSGTSMAAPHVAGTVALYIQSYGRDLDADTDYDQDDVTILRQELIDIAEANGWFPGSDPDSNPEAIVYAGNFGNGDPTPANDPPLANFGYTAANLTVEFVDTSTDSDGTIVARDWDFGDGGTSTAQNPSHTYAAAGTYTVMLTVTDNDGATDSTSQSLTVSDPVPNATISVLSIELSGKKAGPNRSATAVVTVKDNGGNLVEGATVEGNWSGDFSRSVSGVTSSDGTVSFTSGKVRQANALFTFTVTNSVKSGFSYDPSLNVETSVSITVP
jgi:PKD repeat protein